jgi:hypothetical protein
MITTGAARATVRASVRIDLNAWQNGSKPRKVANKVLQKIAMTDGDPTAIAKLASRWMTRYRTA